MQEDHHFYLKKLTLDNPAGLPITKEEFDIIKDSKNKLNNAFYIEEKYDAIVRNYIDIEKYITNKAIDHAITNINTNYENYDFKISLNILLINLLNSFKQYQDQVKSHVKVFYPPENKVSLYDEIKSLFSSEYDKHVEYRLCEQLRNYIQHQNLVIHNIIMGSAWESDDNGNKSRHGFYVHVESYKSKIIEGGGFNKKSVQKEMDDIVDIMSIIKVYFSSHSSVHESIRSIINQSISDSRANIIHHVNSYKENCNTKTLGLHAVSSCGDKVFIDLDWDDVRIDLTKKNKSLKNLNKAFIVNDRSAIKNKMLHRQ